MILNRILFYTILGTSLTVVGTSNARMVFEAGYETGSHSNNNPEIKVVEPAPDRIEASQTVSRKGS